MLCLIGSDTKLPYLQNTFKRAGLCHVIDSFGWLRRFIFPPVASWRNIIFYFLIFFYIYLPLKKLVNEKHFCQKFFWLGLHEIVFFFYFEQKIFSRSCEKFRNIILFADYNKFDSQIFDCYIFCFESFFFQFHSLKFDLIWFNLIFILTLILIFMIVICFFL